MWSQLFLSNKILKAKSIEDLVVRYGPFGQERQAIEDAMPNRELIEGNIDLGALGSIHDDLIIHKSPKIKPKSFEESPYLMAYNFAKLSTFLDRIWRQECGNQTDQGLRIYTDDNDLLERYELEGVTNYLLNRNHYKTSTKNIASPNLDTKSPWQAGASVKELDFQAVRLIYGTDRTGATTVCFGYGTGSKIADSDAASVVAILNARSNDSSSY